MTATNTKTVATMKFDEMTPVQLRKSALEMDTILNAVAPAMKRHRAERVRREAMKEKERQKLRRLNWQLAQAGVQLRVL